MLHLFNRPARPTLRAFPRYRRASVRAAALVAAIGSAAWSVLPAQASTVRPPRTACCTATVNGQAVAMTVTMRGAAAQETFRGTVDQRVSEVLTNVVTSDDGCETLTLLNPSRATVSSGSNCGNGNNVGVGPNVLTVAGTYTVRLTVDSTAIATTRLWVSAPVSRGTVSVNGPAEAMDVTRVGQGVERTFNGTAGKRVKTVVSAVVTSDDGCKKLTLMSPSGVAVASRANCHSRAIDLGWIRLRQTGTYTVLFQVDTAATGTGKLKITS